MHWPLDVVVAMDHLDEMGLHGGGLILAQSGALAHRKDTKEGRTSEEKL